MLIGLNGLKGSGKDTAGAYFVAKYGFERLSFADPLKVSAAAALGLPPDAGIFEDWKNNDDARIILSIDGIEEVNISVRQYLQFYGTEAHRGVFGDDFWTRQLIGKLDADRNYIITDARFVNECSAVRVAGGSIILIQRDAVAGTGDTHASEDALPDELVDTVLYNNGSVEDLYRTIDAYMSISGAITESGAGIEAVSVVHDGVNIDIGAGR